MLIIQGIACTDSLEFLIEYILFNSSNFVWCVNLILGVLLFQNLFVSFSDCVLLLELHVAGEAFNHHSSISISSKIP